MEKEKLNYCSLIYIFQVVFIIYFACHWLVGSEHSFSSKTFKKDRSVVSNCMETIKALAVVVTRIRSILPLVASDDGFIARGITQDLIPRCFGLRMHALLRFFFLFLAFFSFYLLSDSFVGL